jgi:predicted transcriptional regulator of viral defense system
MTAEIEWNSNNGSHADRARELSTAGTMFRARDVGVPAMTLSRLVEAGELRRVGRGVYLGAAMKLHPLWEAAAFSLRVPRAVIGLLTALEYYDLTTSWADGLWVLVPRSRNPPQSKESQLKVVRVQEALLEPRLGIDRIEVHGVTVQITSPTRTVLDCWRYASRIPRSEARSALKALRRSEYWNGRELFTLATGTQLWRRIQPYVEGLE